MPRVWGWRQFSRNPRVYKFKNYIKARIIKVRAGWAVLVTSRDTRFSEFEYKKLHRRWTSAYNDLCDQMKLISKTLRKRVRTVESWS